MSVCEGPIPRYESPAVLLLCAEHEFGFLDYRFRCLLVHVCFSISKLELLIVLFVLPLSSLCGVGHGTSLGHFRTLLKWVSRIRLGVIRKCPIL